MMPGTYAMHICWALNVNNIAPLITESLPERLENQFSDR